MIKSMTGYGRQEVVLGNTKFTFEIKSLNSKQLDYNSRIPYTYKDKEIEIKTLITNKLIRGKVDFSFQTESIQQQQGVGINKELVQLYYKELSDIATLVGEQNTNLLSMVLRMPEVLKEKEKPVSEEEWGVLMGYITASIHQLDEFRSHEGEILKQTFLASISTILFLLKEVDQYEGERLETVRQRIRKQVVEFSGDKTIDESRLEQELIYYIEKFDVTEEKIRLKKHCDYFIATLNAENEEAIGKKLGFVCQEIGREINTLGSKSNHFDMQVLVVKMKDDLEKIKEQLLNIL